MIQNLICGIPFFFFFWKYYFGHAAFLYLSRRSNWHHHSFSLISDFLAENLKANKSWQKRSHILQYSFPQQFYELQFTWNWKWYPLTTQSKAFLTLQIFQQTCLCFVSEKIFALHPFLTPNNCILEALWKQMFVYFYISTYENVSFRDVVRFHLMGNELGEKWITSLRQLTFYASQKVLQYFILIEIFKNSAIFQHLDTCIYSIKTLKFSRQVGLQG